MPLGLCTLPRSVFDRGPLPLVEPLVAPCWPLMMICVCAPTAAIAPVSFWSSDTMERSKFVCRSYTH
eukprot:7719653-Prorocentrum_lima.AAC.1